MRGVPLAAIVVAAASAWRVRPMSLLYDRSRTRHVAMAREVALWLAVGISGLTIVEIAHRMRCAPAAVARATAEVQRDVRALPAFAATCYAIERELLDALDAREAA